MSRLPDIVVFKKLETQFIPDKRGNDIICHKFDDGTPASWMQAPKRREYWKRHRQRVGRGSYGVIWLERCVKGRAEGQLRAVKQFPAPITPTECERELLAIAVFSHDKVCVLSTWYQVIC